jgi:hypothetical protein
MTDLAHDLAIRIARCPHVDRACHDANHPCATVVATQTDLPQRQLPEPWFGNITGARVLFISSNPSIDDTEGPAGEEFPTADWNDDRVGDWVVNRVNQERDAPSVTFGTSGYKDFFVKCRDGAYRGFQRHRAQSQRTWANTHQVAVELIGASAHPGINYAITEVVHCKSRAAIGVPEAAATCSDAWLPDIVALAAECRVVVLSGAKVRDNWARSFFDDLPAKFGKRAGQTETGPAVACRDIVVSDAFDGNRRIYVYLPHATSTEKGNRRLPSRRFGADVTQMLNDIANHRRAVPIDTPALGRYIDAVSARSDQRQPSGPLQDGEPR